MRRARTGCADTGTIRKSHLPASSKKKESFMRRLPEFRNEPYADFSLPENRHAMEAALQKVRSELGREYELLIAGERVKAAEKLVSLNPSNPKEVVGIHQKATAETASRAVDSAH